MPAVASELWVIVITGLVALKDPANEIGLSSLNSASEPTYARQHPILSKAQRL